MVPLFHSAHSGTEDQPSPSGAPLALTCSLDVGWFPCLATVADMYEASS